jgi:ABC-2 type transport system ATP-binding protein
MIQLSNVNKSLRKKPVLCDVSITFDGGNCYLIQGTNGSGKTMLLRMICGLIHPDSGAVKIQPACRFGVIIENPEFMANETAWENLWYLAKIRGEIGKREIEEALRKVNLYEYRNKKVKTFSLGMRQRLAICQAIMENPDVLLLDEPFNALDETNCNAVKAILAEYKEHNKIVIIAAHMVSFRELFDQIITLDEGKIVSTEVLLC